MTKTNVRAHKCVLCRTYLISQLSVPGPPGSSNGDCCGGTAWLLRWARWKAAGKGFHLCFLPLSPHPAIIVSFLNAFNFLKQFILPSSRQLCECVCVCVLVKMYRERKNVMPSILMFLCFFSFFCPLHSLDVRFFSFLPLLKRHAGRVDGVCHVAAALCFFARKKNTHHSLLDVHHHSGLSRGWFEPCIARYEQVYGLPKFCYRENAYKIHFSSSAHKHDKLFR